MGSLTVAENVGMSLREADAVGMALAEDGGIAVGVDGGESARVGVAGGFEARVAIGGEVYERVPERYDGPYEVVPTQSGQTLRTSSLLLSQDIEIGPIPSNYGLITWDGSTMTVS